MKKKVFKKWLDIALKVITLVAILIASTECKDTKIFMYKSIICLIVVILNSVLLVKFGRDDYE